MTKPTHTIISKKQEKLLDKEYGKGSTKKMLDHIVKVDKTLWPFCSAGADNNKKHKHCWHYPDFHFRWCCFENTIEVEKVCNEEVCKCKWKPAKHSNRFWESLFK